MPTPWPFFTLSQPRPLTADDALPGISASEDDFMALVQALHATIDTFHDTHPGLTYGDVIHAVDTCKHFLIQDYLTDTADA